MFGSFKANWQFQGARGEEEGMSVIIMGWAQVAAALL